jgi:hypothetical protein
VDAAGVRRAAVALPELEQYEHGGLPAFRSLPDDAVADPLEDAWARRAPRR